MSQICPTVTAFDIATFNAQLALVGLFADRIHIDLMDGDFTPTKSPEIKEISLPPNIDIDIDIHIMFRDPRSCIDMIKLTKPSLVIIHPESEVDIPLFASALREHDIKTGLALLPQTTVDSVNQLLPHVQHVLLFGGRLGYHGGSADLTQLAKASQLRTASRYLEIGWDGGANLENVSQIKDAGIDVINVGGCIHSADDPIARYKELVNLVA